MILLIPYINERYTCLQLRWPSATYLDDHRLEHLAPNAKCSRPVYPHGSHFTPCLLPGRICACTVSQRIMLGLEFILSNLEFSTLLPEYISKTAVHHRAGSTRHSNLKCIGTSTQRPSHPSDTRLWYRSDD